VIVWIAPSPDKRIVLPETIAAQAAHAHARAAVLEERARVAALPGDDENTLGTVLLIAGLAVLVPSTLLWSGRVALGR
jgi:hypothetical protein